MGVAMHRALVKRAKGFTLLELLMVVIIIAVLASIALPQYIRASEKARMSEALQLLGTLRASQGRYKAQSTNGVYAAVIADLDADMPVNTRYFGNGNMPVAQFNATRAFYVRNTGAAGFTGKSIGIFWDNGALCGNANNAMPGLVPC